MSAPKNSIGTQKNTESFPVFNADCIRRGFAEKPSEQVDAIRDYGAAPAFPSCRLSADVAGSAANDYNGSESRGRSTSDVLESFMEEMNSSGILDAYLESHGSSANLMPPGNVSDNGRVVCEAKGDGIDERSFETTAFLHSQLAFGRNTSSSGFYSKEDTEVSECFGNEMNGLSMKEKGLFLDPLIETSTRPDESVFSPTQDIANSLQGLTFDKELEEFDIFDFHLTFGSASLSSVKHSHEGGMGMPAGVVPLPLPPLPLPPPASATPATHHVEGLSAGLNPASVTSSHSKGSDGKLKTPEHMQGLRSMLEGSSTRAPSLLEDRQRLMVARRSLSHDSEGGTVICSNSVASGTACRASFPNQLSSISEQSAQDTEECILPPPNLSPLALATYYWLKKSGKVSRAVLRAGFLPDQICVGDVTVEPEANELVSLAVKQYTNVAKKWFGPDKGRDSYDFKLALQKTFRKYGETKVEHIYNGAGRKFILCEEVSKGILEEMKNQAKWPDNKRLPDLSSEAHQAMGGAWNGADGTLLARSSFPQSRWHDCSGKTLNKKRKMSSRIKSSLRSKKSKKA